MNQDKARTPSSWTSGAKGTYEDAVLRTPRFFEHLRAIALREANLGLRLNVAKSEGFSEIAFCSGSYTARDPKGRLEIRDVAHALVMYNPDGRVRVFATEETSRGITSVNVTVGEENVTSEYNSRAQFVKEAGHLSNRNLRCSLDRFLEVLYNPR